MFTYTGEWPRHYWAGHSDAELIAARDEYRTTDHADLLSTADEIDDDLARRAALAEAEAQGGYSSGWALAALLVSLLPMSVMLVFVARLAGAVGAVA